MFAADRPPSKIGSIDDRLRSRFEGGLVLEVEASGADLAKAMAAPPGPKPGDGAEKVVPPLEEFIIDDSGRGGLYPTPQVVQKEPEEKNEAGQTRKKDISTLDREWIMGFTAGSSVEAEGNVSGASAAEKEAAASADVEPLDEAWFPSPEGVVWEWPRMDERVVEDPD